MADRSRPKRRRTESGARDTGAVTAELAVVLPAVTLVLAAVLSVGEVVMAKVACVDAARAGARAAARGDDPAAVRLAASAAAGAADGIEIGMAQTPDVVEVTVSRPVRLLAISPSVQVSARAFAQSEQLRGNGES